jgi:hypothetical protein
MKDEVRRFLGRTGIVRAALVASVAIVLACGAAGCQSKTDDTSGEVEESTEASKETSKDTSVEPSVDGDGDSQQKTQLTSKEMYEGFLRGEIPVYCDNQEYTYYKWDDGEEHPYFEKSVGYTLKELVGRIQQVETVSQDTDTRVGSVSHVMLDCGDDGEPELALQVACEGDVWGEGTDYSFVIKNIDGKLQICYRTVSGYRSYNEIINHYGYIDDSYYWGMGWSTTCGFMDASGKYQYVYNVTADSGYGYNYGGDDPLSKAFAEAGEEASEELFDSFEILAYRFQEWQEDENATEIVKYSYEVYCEEGDPIEQEVRDLVEGIFAKANFKLYTQDEIVEMLQNRYKECGLTSAMTDYEYEEFEWAYLERKDFWPGKVANVKSVDELMAAVENDALIFLAPGTYNVTQWLKAGDNFDKIPRWKFEDEGEINYPGILYTGWDDDSWEIMLYQMKNIVLASADAYNPAKIVCECPMSRVLAFEECGFIDLQDIVFGHEIEPGYCSGDVLSFDQCYFMDVKGCDLYGCGAHALEIWKSHDITISDSVIHDCTYGCMTMYDPGYVIIRNTIFENCKEFDMFTLTEGSAYFDSCTFRNLNGNMVNLGEYGYMTFSDCQFDVNALNSLQKNPKYDSQIYVY